MNRRQAGFYLVAQGAIGVLWWLLLYTSLSVRGWFVADSGWPVARSLVLADLIGFGCGSLATGIAVLQHRQWAGGAAVAVSAVTAYAHSWPRPGSWHLSIVYSPFLRWRARSA